jgi:hypothetical protein
MNDIWVGGRKSVNPDQGENRSQGIPLASLQKAYRGDKSVFPPQFWTMAAKLHARASGDERDDLLIANEFANFTKKYPLENSFIIVDIGSSHNYMIAAMAKKELGVDGTFYIPGKSAYIDGKLTFLKQGDDYVKFQVADMLANYDNISMRVPPKYKNLQITYLCAHRLDGYSDDYIDRHLDGEIPDLPPPSVLPSVSELKAKEIKTVYLLREGAVGEWKNFIIDENAREDLKSWLTECKNAGIEIRVIGIDPRNNKILPSK